MEAGNWFHSGIVRNTVEFQSGDDFRVALGRSSLSGLETPLGVLFDFLMSTVSEGMLTDPCNILYNKIIRWSCRRSANGRHFMSFRSCVTLMDPYWPRAQRAAFLCTFSMESESLLRMGSQMLEQYSSWDLVRAMKAVSRHLYGLPRRLRLIKPNRWWALLTMVATCWDQLKSCVRVTPKSPGGALLHWRW